MTGTEGWLEALHSQTKKEAERVLEVGLDCEASRVTLSDPLIPVRLYFLNVLQPSQTMLAGHQMSKHVTLWKSCVNQTAVGGGGYGVLLTVAPS